MTRPAIDITKFPPDERPHIVEMATTVNVIKQDVDNISGVTDEEKAAAHKLFNLGRKAARYFHSKRFNVFLLSAQGWILIYAAKALGVNLELVGRVVNKLLEHWANAL